ncbi:MAG: AAA family ATPase [Thermoleophilia bacterium]|nr:AAA family ATPase [Thermoleophilia bacterium]
MYLRSIKLRGFKSFPDAVEVRLEPGVAVIVGPNGSGKSNIADAIVWAAGSLAPSALRAEKPDDVLFAGSAGRPGSDHCEVELVFDNSAGDGPLPYAEISVARRLARGGEGHYLVNRASVRRTDLVELLADAGLGHEMHAVIGQGRVEQVLSSKPAERRALIEEAAGLGSFKQRRHRAELKLARVRILLDRAQALEEESRKRLRPLALQATAAQRAERLGQEIDRLALRLAAGNLARLERRLAELEERRLAAVHERARRDERLEGLLAERRRAEEELEQAARRHEQATAALYRLRSGTERLAMRHESAQEMAGKLRRDAARARRLADAPRDEAPLEELASAERALADAGKRSRATLHARESLEGAARLAADRLQALDRSLAEREGLPPAARALADGGAQLALAALDVDAGYERAAAAALFHRAAAILADDPPAALALAERARVEGLGTLTVLVPPVAPPPTATDLPFAGAERLADRVRPLPGGERVAALLAGVLVVGPDDLPRVERGVAVTREGHGFDPARGELWFAGVAAESVLMELHARRRALAAEVEKLRADAAAAALEAAGTFAVERAARDRVTRARASVALMPQTVDPAEAELLERLADAGERLVATLAACVVGGGRFEAPLRARVDAGGASSAALGEELRALGGREAELRRAAAEATQVVTSLEVDAARVAAECDDVRRRLPDGVEAEELADAEGEELRATLARLERRREQLGQVNPLAAEELEREKASLAELTAQREDLERSLDELEQLRAELTETVERRFEETYAAVERHFAEVASALFPGGEGRLRLTIPESEEEEPGVEVELRPAGKRVTRLSLLSGGEKALGALSFLFALFLARPCPFYLLDEVEAALDDTNIGRFVELLRRYADRAQFVVITHQKRTMEAADILYGVTMASDGISQVVSKRLRAGAADAAVA